MERIVCILLNGPFFVSSPDLSITHRLYILRLFTSVSQGSVSSLALWAGVCVCVSASTEPGIQQASNKYLGSKGVYMWRLEKASGVGVAENEQRLHESGAQGGSQVQGTGENRPV